jgi:hypothetical protein
MRLNIIYLNNICNNNNNIPITKTKLCEIKNIIMTQKILYKQYINFIQNK